MEPCPEGSEMTETESAEDDNSEMPEDGRNLTRKYLVDQTGKRYYCYVPID